MAKAKTKKPRKRKTTSRAPKLARGVKAKCTGICRLRTKGMRKGDVRYRSDGPRKYEILRVN